MTLASKLIAVQTLAPGDGVGYGGTFHAPREMRIGVVACGYADGYPRHAPNGTPVLVGGHRVPMAGRVSMDMLTVDLTGVPDAQVGTDVVLWGEGLPVDDVAMAASTVGYELLCAVAPRVPFAVRER
jgi:alanine racemase